MMITTTIRIDEKMLRALETEAQRHAAKPRALARLLIGEGLERRGHLLTAPGDDRMIAGGQGVDHGH